MKLDNRTRLILQFAKKHTHRDLPFTSASVAYVLQDEYSTHMPLHSVLHHVLAVYLAMVNDPRSELGRPDQLTVINDLLLAPAKGPFSVAIFANIDTKMTVGQMIESQIGYMLGQLSICRSSWIEDEEFRSSFKKAWNETNPHSQVE